jgi:hypothetical protein
VYVNSVLEYPSIDRTFQEIPHAHVFDKIDGSSMRSEYSRKRGFYKHGRRYGLLDGASPALEVVPDLFERTLRESLERLARDNRWDNLVVFYEFYGVKSLSGLHVEGDPKFLSVFDASLDRETILPPDEFRKLFEGEVPTPRFLGRFNWTRGFIDTVWRGEVEGVTFEGVVGKGHTKRGILRGKAKTKAWIDQIHARFSPTEAKKIVES